MSGVAAKRATILLNMLEKSKKEIISDAVKRYKSKLDNFYSKKNIFELIKGLNNNEYSLRLIDNEFHNWVLQFKEDKFPKVILGTNLKESYVNAMSKSNITGVTGEKGFTKGAYTKVNLVIKLFIEYIKLVQKEEIFLSKNDLYLPLIKERYGNKFTPKKLLLLKIISSVMALSINYFKKETRESFEQQLKDLYKRLIKFGKDIGLSEADLKKTSDLIYGFLSSNKEPKKSLEKKSMDKLAKELDKKLQLDQLSPPPGVTDKQKTNWIEKELKRMDEQGPSQSKSEPIKPSLRSEIMSELKEVYDKKESFKVPRITERFRRIVKDTFKTIKPPTIDKPSRKELKQQLEQELKLMEQIMIKSRIQAIEKNFINELTKFALVERNLNKTVSELNSFLLSKPTNNKKTINEMVELIEKFRIRFQEVMILRKFNYEVKNVFKDNKELINKISKVFEEPFQYHDQLIFNTKKITTAFLFTIKVIVSVLSTNQEDFAETINYVKSLIKEIKNVKIRRFKIRLSSSYYEIFKELNKQNEKLMDILVYYLITIKDKDFINELNKSKVKEPLSNHEESFSKIFNLIKEIKISEKPDWVKKIEEKFKGFKQKPVPVKALEHRAREIANMVQDKKLKQKASQLKEEYLSGEVLTNVAKLFKKAEAERLKDLFNKEIENTKKELEKVLGKEIKKADINDWKKLKESPAFKDLLETAKKVQINIKV